MVLLPALIIALGGWREPLVLADVLGDDGVALRERTIAFLIDRLRTPHFEPTNRLRYWLGYADDRQAQAYDARETSLPNRADQLTARMRAFTATQQAALLTHQFALEDPADWVDEARTLGGDMQFLTRYIDHLDQGGTDRLRDVAWHERLWLARIDPSQRDEIALRFARERPQDSFDAAWAGTFDDDSVALPEGTLTSIDAVHTDLRRSRPQAWTILLVWDVRCQTCLADLVRFAALAREFPEQVLTITADDDSEAVRLWLADHSLTVPVGLVDRSVVEQLRAVPGSKFVISPRGMSTRLRGERWEEDARHALQAPSAPQAPRAP
ncbi:MAG TPA: hypothetical protein VFA59_07520 [Vicinamibacterales bacterium]|nr:hypothetical protein [Vicinamibacterales bacterium]